MAATEAQIRANRANAQKSTGPKSDAGKARARMNALKHGMRSKNGPVLPHEDPAELEARVNLWVEDWEPQNAIERELVERAAKASWALERAERYEAALLARRVRRAMLTSRAKGAAKVAALGQRLFAIVGSFASGKAAPPSDDEPAAIVATLEDSPEGVRWMLDRWAEIRTLIDDGHLFTYSDKYKFVRLLGKQAGDAVDDPALNAIFLAWEELEEDGGVGFWKRLRRDSPFHDPTYSQWQHWRELAPPPADEDEARATLRAVVDGETDRLSERLAELEEVEGDDALERAEAASFLPGVEGERLRRYQSARARELFRAVQTLTKMRKDAAKHDHKTSSPLEGEDRSRSDQMRGTTAVANTSDPTDSPNAKPVVPLIRPCGPPSPSRGEGRRGSDSPETAGATAKRRDFHTARFAASQKATNEPNAAAIEASVEHEVTSIIAVPSPRKRTRPRTAV
ncbi:hypothetical protein [Paludisphaera rhizosphaerae]|uniref:hypothetical protein n=1 Tax=Paludisphaera rhizosphaerae TaxID=2711216 RepID=UPI0013EAF5A9|nr:hypothetical protein [Paludisphaera rhizosphaerae]